MIPARRPIVTLLHQCRCMALLMGLFVLLPMHGQWTRLNDLSFPGFSNHSGLCRHHDAWYVPSFNHLFRSTDGCHSWAPTPGQLPDSIYEVQDVISYHDHLIIATDRGIYRSADDAATWEASLITFGAPPYDYFSNPFWFKILDDELYLIASWDFIDGGGLYRTPDNGATWVNLTSSAWSPTQSISDITKKNGVLYADNYLHLYASYDGGQTWEMATQLEVYIQPLALTTWGDRLLCYDQYEHRPRYSLDDGYTWTNATVLSDQFYGGENMVVLGGYVYLVNNLRVYRSTDGGISYSQYMGGDMTTYMQYMQRLFVIGDSVYAFGENDLFVLGSETAGIRPQPTTDAGPGISWDGAMLGLLHADHGHRYTLDMTTTTGQRTFTHTWKADENRISPGPLATGPYVVTVTDDRGARWIYRIMRM